MHPPRYPLEPLAELRNRKAEGALDELASAVSERQAAESRRGECEEDGRKSAEAAARARTGEWNALSRGELRAADLACAVAWESRVASERDALASSLEQARRTEEGARAAEDASRARALARSAEAQVVARDRARWDDARREDVEAREEEALTEAWRSHKP